MKLDTCILLCIACFVSQCANGCIKKYKTCGCKNMGLKQTKRLYCHNIDVVDLFANTDFPVSDLVKLDLSHNYNLREISRETFGHNEKTINILRGIMKLDLSQNAIWKIAPGTFSLFTNLTQLNLSGNSIGLLSPDMFLGLSSLRALDLSENIFPIIPGKAFTSLTNLKKLNVESTNLVCNCLMQDFVRWMESSKYSVKGTCHLPMNFRGETLKHLIPDKMKCDLNNTLDSLPLFEMIPVVPQLTFEGDSIKMQCEGTNLPESKVFWSFNGSPINLEESSSFSFSVTSNLYKSIITGSLTINNLTKEHSGSWNCTVTSEHGSATKTVHIEVAERYSNYCQQEAVKNDRGTFSWPSTLSGMTRTLTCPEKNFVASDRLPLADRKCISGNWSFERYDACPYADEVTERVKNILNESLSEKNIGAFLKSLWKSIGEKPLKYPLAVELIGELMEKVSPLTTNENEKTLASPLLNLASYVMQANETTLKQAQQNSGACDKILRAIRNYALEMPTLPTFDEGSKNIAIGGSMVPLKELYNGMSCKVIRSKDSLKFACDKSKANSHAIQSSIIFPKTFLDSCQDSSAGYRLYYIAYRDGSLFQSVPNDSAGGNSTSKTTRIDTNSIVLETGIRGCDMMNLSHPINYFFETSSPGGHYGAVWSPQGWTESDSEDCSTFYGSRNFTRVECSKLSTVVVIKDPNAKSCDKDLWFLIDVAHPVTLVGTAVLVICLVSVILSYACCYNKITMSSEHKHMVVNICVHLLIASSMFAFGIRRIDHRNICIACGIILHYTSLSVLLWITLGVRNIYRELAVLTRPPSLEPKPPRPMLRFYLVGWGIPVLICGITAAAKVQNYGGEEGQEKYCWLLWETSIFAFYCPAAFIAVVCIILLLRVLCAFSRHSSQLDSQRSPLARASWNGNTRVSNTSDRYQAINTGNASFHGNMQSSNAANSLAHPVSPIHGGKMSGQSFKNQLCGAALLFIFYLLTWVFAALSIAAPSAQPRSGYQDYFMDVRSYRDNSCYRKSMSLGTKTIVEDVFSYAYTIMTIVMGIFMVLQHLACRTDVRSSWRKLIPCISGHRYGENVDARSSSPGLENSVKDNVTEEVSEYLTSANDKSKNRRGVYTTIKTDPTMETIVHSTDTGRNDAANASHYLQYHPGTLPKSCLDEGTAYQPEFMRSSIHETGRPAKSITSLHSSCKVKHPGHIPLRNASLHGHSHVMSSSGQRHNSHPFTHDHYNDIGLRTGFLPDPRSYRLHGFHNHHIPHQEHSKPVKLTNLHVARHDSSMTEHSFDEMAHNNMHTIPVVLQHHTQPKVNNGALVDRYQKVRRALERKRAKQKRLNVLREYAQDPLTSNDEGQKDGKDSSVNESSPLIQSPEKTSPNHAIGVSQGGLKFRPLLLSPSNRKQDFQRPKNNGPTKRVKRLDASGHPRPMRQDKRAKQNSRISHNSTLSEREQDTSCSENSKMGANGSTKLPINNASSVTKHNFDSQVTADGGRDNHGYLTLQQLQSANPFLFQNPVTMDAKSSPPVPDSKLNNFNKSDKLISNSSLNSSQILQRNETSV